VSEERRREPRYPARIAARFQRQGETMEVFTGDVSFRGVFLRTDIAPGLRQLIRVSLVLPDGLVVSAHAMVVHVTKPGGNGRAGVGLQFWGAMEKSDEWQKFVRGLAAEKKTAEATRRVDVLAKAPEHVRRTSERVKLSLDVVLGGDPTITRDVSETGMAIRTELMPQVGAQITVVVRAGKRAYPIEVVVRRKIDEPGFRGIGVEFVGLSDKAKTALVGFIRIAMNPPAPKNAPQVKPGDPDLH
jgi:hypothetical protein